jgi:hypothetical protein
VRVEIRTSSTPRAASSATLDRHTAAWMPTTTMAIPAITGAARPSRAKAMRAPFDAITTAGTVPSQNDAITSAPSAGDALPAAIAANA